MYARSGVLWKAVTILMIRNIKQHGSTKLDRLSTTWQQILALGDARIQIMKSFRKRPLRRALLITRPTALAIVGFSTTRFSREPLLLT